MSRLLITKSTGEQQEFEPRKLVRSLEKAGASPDRAATILLEIEREIVSGMTTSEIYRRAFVLLRQAGHHAVASRYSMKRAITELGPNGFPFEKFIAEIFRAEGYEAVTDQTVQGACVEHEVDVVAWKGDELVMVEAKFHNEYGMKSDIKVALYVKARWDDLKDGEYVYGGKKRRITSFQLFTNTKFTEHAIRYASCKGLQLIGWNYPPKGNLEELVQEAGVHPLTSLTTLTQVEKKILLDAGLVLCKQVAAEGSNLARFGFKPDKVDAVISEIHHLCG